MPREIDVRDFSISRVTDARMAALRSAESSVSGLLSDSHQVRVAGIDPTTGNASVIVSVNAPPQQGAFVQRALAHLQNVSQLAGLTPGQPVEYRADPQFLQTSSGGVAVYVQQHYKAVPVFDAARTVRFTPDGALDAVVGRTESIKDDVAVLPTLGAREAVRRAAEFLAEPDAPAADQFGQPRPPVALDLSSLDPRVTAEFSGNPTHATVLEAPPFEGAILASLAWFKHGDDLRLAWEIVLTLPEAASQFRTLVDASSGEILYAKELMRSLAARANVFRLDGSGQREMVTFPLGWDQYGLPVPPDLAGTTPTDWIDDRGQTQGNSVRAHLEDSGGTFAGRQEDGHVVFDPPDPRGDDQKILNTFFYCCMMHDLFYLLGFRERDGNFQSDNFGLGASGDPVDARVYRGEVPMTASMWTPVDGSSPIMRMGLVSGTGRHTALDATVVYHEFTHGVTNRLVGGPLNTSALEAPQSAGMGEGWGDYVACVVTGLPVVGAWVVNRPQGIRAFPYDERFPVASNNFGSLGQGRYNEAHNIGEIWCAALMALDREVGRVLTLQLVVDALKLAPANPSFLQMRDAILVALNNKLAAGQLSQAERDTAWNGSWTVFARFGMGPQAASNGASLQGIRADFTVPAPGTPPQQLPLQQPSPPEQPRGERIGTATPALDADRERGARSHPGGILMSTEVDRRDEQPGRLTPQRQAELRARAAEVTGVDPDLRVRIEEFDARTGNPQRVVLSGTQPGRKRFVERALEHTRAIAPALGLAPTQTPEFSADPAVAETTSGAAAVHLRQEYKGIPIFGADTTVRFSPDGAVAEVVGTTVTVPADVPVSPTLGAEEAVMRAVKRAARHERESAPRTDSFGQPIPPVAVDVTSFVPTVVSASDTDPTQPTVLEPGPFDDITASLSWFPVGEELRLGWEVRVRLQSSRELHAVVDARSGEILYATSVT